MDVKRIEAIAPWTSRGGLSKLFSYPFSKNFESSFLPSFYLSSNRSMGRYFGAERKKLARRIAKRNESRPSLLYPSKMLLIPGNATRDREFCRNRALIAAPLKLAQPAIKVARIN